MTRSTKAVRSAALGRRDTGSTAVARAPAGAPALELGASSTLAEGAGNRVILGDNLAVLPTLPAGFARLVYIDPPFNTGRTQKRARIAVTVDPSGGDRSGFGGRRYASRARRSPSYLDRYDDFLAFLMPRVEASLRCLRADGSLFIHLDSREVHYVKIALDELLGRERFMNEIIWAYDFGGRSRTRWPAKHDTILWYALDPDAYVFDYAAMDRLPYMAPKLVTREKAARGKTPTDVWWHTIVPTHSAEKTGYPTQKPLGIVRRIVRVHSAPGDVVLDYFAGSGTTGEAAAAANRRFVLIDDHPAAVKVMAKRLARFEPVIERAPKSKPARAGRVAARGTAR